MAAKPPLPPRTPSAPDSRRVSLNPQNLSSDQYLSPPTHSPSGSPYLGGIRDPRNSSTQSLGAVKSADDQRRTLLLVYIHGFLGDETSFKSFPAHVHGLLSPTLAATHVVYTKIYPRYKSRENITVARNALSNWLVPHESESTDIILLGHSLGGILAADLILMQSNEREGLSLQHRILGLIAFDTPFLGMHPGVVGTGIASLFRTPPQLEEPALLGPSPFSDSSSAQQDPTYNPRYTNDVRLANRKGKLQRAWYFWNKHAGELATATKKYVSSHLEFGGCLADYPGLKKRYRAIRALEDVVDTTQPRDANGRLMRRVRFVNYYTASTGRIREDLKESQEQPESTASASETPLATPAFAGDTQSNPADIRTTPRLSLEEYREDEVLNKDVVELSIDATPPQDCSSSFVSRAIVTPPGEDQVMEEQVDANSGTAAHSLLSRPSSTGQDGSGPPVTAEQAPENHKAIDQMWGTVETLRHDQDTPPYCGLAAKQHEAGDTQAIQDQPLLQSKQTTEDPGSDVDQREKSLESAESSHSSKAQANKKRKDRKFCALPTKDTRTGERDRTWIRVHMEGIDEVVAHTSLFKIGETYGKLLGDTVERIQEWIAEDASTRMVLAELSNDR
ncbi:hypothetical protein KCU88_g1638, partial [Aureobasidium melanogenum]